MDLSLVIPAYNEEESIAELTAWIARVMQEASLSYEVVFIDDGSTDRTWQEIQRVAGLYPVRGFRFQHNYGKSAALDVGFMEADGDVVVTMDADMQDSPDELPELYRMVMEDGYDLVSGWKKKRRDPLGKRLPSKLFNRTARAMSGIRLHDFNCGLKAYRKDVVKSIEVYGEMHRYIPLLAKSAGFRRIGEKPVTHYARRYGKSKYGLERMMRGYLDLLTVTFLTRFSKSPMYFFGMMGTLLFLIGGIFAIYIIVRKLYLQGIGEVARAVTDQPLFFLSLIAIILGTQLFLSGFIAELIVRKSYRKGEYRISDRV